MSVRHRRLNLVFFIVVTTGCSDIPVAKKIDSTTTGRTAAPPVTGLSLGTGWDSVAGLVVVFAASKPPINVVVILPGLTDSALAATSHFELRGLANIPVDLFGLRGFMGSSILEIASQSSNATGCVSWPNAKLAGQTPSGWKVALQEGRAVGIPLDSMEGLTGADSAKFVADVLNAAQSLTDEADPVFHGIPFFLRKGYRLVTPASSVVIAEAVRKINEEANPREEHLFLLAERSNNNPVYHVAFHTRSAGVEESLETSEILAALRLTQSKRVSMFMTFEYEDGGKIGLLERLAANNWQIVWKSAYTGC